MTLANQIEKILEKLAEEQKQAVIRAVNKKGLMETGWDDIDEEGGSLSFKIIAQTIADNLVLDEEKIIDTFAVTNDLRSGEDLKDFWVRVAHAISQAEGVIKVKK